jgi:hypothetical protein
MSKYNITPDITCLRNMFLSRNVDGINLLMEKYKLKPDITCIENVVIDSYIVGKLVNIVIKELKIEK